MIELKRTTIESPGCVLYLGKDNDGTWKGYWHAKGVYGEVIMSLGWDMDGHRISANEYAARFIFDQVLESL